MYTRVDSSHIAWLELCGSFLSSVVTHIFVPVGGMLEILRNIRVDAPLAWNEFSAGCRVVQMSVAGARGRCPTHNIFDGTMLFAEQRHSTCNVFPPVRRCEAPVRM